MFFCHHPNYANISLISQLSQAWGHGSLPDKSGRLPLDEGEDFAPGKGLEVSWDIHEYWKREHKIEKWIESVTSVL